MKPLFTTLFIFLYSLNYSQTLTNRQVYDFEVGDVFQTRVYHSSNTVPTFFSDTVINKYFSLNNDTVFYGINRLTYIPSQPTPTYNYSSIIEVYPNLDSVAQHDEPIHCSNVPVTDTIYNSPDYCNQNIWKISSNADTNCFEDTYYNSTLIEGCGGPYYDAISVAFFYEKVLVYFKKDNTSCGTSFTTDISEINALEGLFIFPNPTSSKLYFTSSNKRNYSSYVITNFTGKILKTNSIENEIDISGLATGIYYISFLMENGKKVTQKFLKN